MTTTTDATSRPETESIRAGRGLGRISGAGGLLFVLLLGVDNAIRAGAPRFGASGASVTAYAEAHRTAMIVPIALFPLGLLGLFTFASGVWSAARADRDSRWWAQRGRSRW